MTRVVKSASVVIALIVATASFALPAAAATDVTFDEILSGYSRPLLVTHSTSSAKGLYIGEQAGKIKRARFQDGSWQKLGTFLDISDRVDGPEFYATSPRGLIGLTFHPRFKRNGKFYVMYTRNGADGADGQTVVSQFRRASSGHANPASERIVMVIKKSGLRHYGGQLAFGPDGLLYVAVGDGGETSPWRNGQDRSTRLGKLLRIKPNDPDGNGPKTYSVPKSNPYVGKTGRNDIWSTGLREPWRFSFDRKNGNLWIGDVGLDRREEVDRSRSNNAGQNAGRGANYGWSRCEGSLELRPNPEHKCDFGVKPVYDYGHDASRCSVTGGYVHRGPDAKKWRGLYVAGDFCGRVFVLNKKGKVRFTKPVAPNVTAFGEDGPGRLFAVDVLSGKLFRVRLSGARP